MALVGWSESGRTVARINFGSRSPQLYASHFGGLSFGRANYAGLVDLNFGTDLYIEFYIISFLFFLVLHSLYVLLVFFFSLVFFNFCYCTRHCAGQ